jgi:hypothetical protein
MSQPGDGRAAARERHAAGVARDGERPWERPGAVRRDCEPHRGALLLALARVSVVLGFLSLAGGVAAPAALAVGVAAVVLCARDEREMAAGRRDPAGRGPLEDARGIARYGVLCALLFGSVALAVLLMSL